MDAPTREYKEKLAAQIIKRLAKRRMEGSYAATAAQAKAEILAMLPKTGSIYRTGSESVAKLGIWDEIAKLDGIKVFNPYQPGLSPAEGLEVRRQGLLADVMLASTNAITIDGVLVNLDGSANRVAAMAHGPHKVILLVGMNKVAGDLESAMSRVRNLAAPLNNLRLKSLNPAHNPPCVEDGRCHNCLSPDKICCIWSIIEFQRVEGRIHVKLVGEDLGY